MKRILPVMMLLFIPQISLSLSIDISPNPVWFGEPLSISANCTYNSSAHVWLDIESPIIMQNLTFSEDNQTFHLTYSNMPELGTYTGTVHCVADVEETNQSISFLVRDLDAKIEKLKPENFYTDSRLTITVNITEVSDHTYNPNSGIGFELLEGSSTINLSPEDIYFKDGLWFVSPDYIFSEGEHHLNLRIEYQGKSIEAPFILNVLQPLNVKILSLTGDVKPYNNITIEPQVTYKGSSLSLSELNDLKIYLDSEEMPFSVQGNRITIELPDKDPGTYTLKLECSYEGAHASAETRISYLIGFTGTLVDIDNNLLSGTITFEKNGFSKRVTVNGDYSFSVPAGTYTVKVENFPGLKKAVFEGVEVNGETENFIRIDHFTSDDLGVPGIRIAGGLGLEMVLPFDSVKMEIGYDSSVVRDESELKLYTCENWNFDARRCSGEWEELSAAVDRISNVVKITTTHLSGFIVGEEERADIMFKTDKDAYFFGEEIVVTGTVRDGNQNPIPNAEVRYFFNDQTGTVRTTHDGIFSFTLTAPENPGTYRIEASLPEYSMETFTEEVTVEGKKALTLILPDDSEIPYSEESTFDIKIVNSGQVDLNDLDVVINGLPEGTFTCSPDRIEKLSRGEQKSVTLRFIPPNTSKNYQVTVTVSNRSIEETESFVLMVTGPAMSETQDQEPPFTGFITFVESVNPFDALSGITLIGIIFYSLKITRKKKEPRGSIRGIMFNIKNEIEKSSFEFKEEYKCKKCGRTFKSKRALGIHLSKKH
ncbi:MAG: hypothetical protein DRP11_03340 [Candidatus Aenigmatarchaeota archaeon]|nr:MAG: hypothetical protein DRP11_03340 [Candidatus Aenigmarchaeota archaeon]